MNEGSGTDLRNWGWYKKFEDLFQMQYQSNNLVTRFDF